jgi:hypothetical protein
MIGETSLLHLSPGKMRQAAARDSRRVYAVWNGKRAEPVAMVELQAQPMVFCYSLTGVRSSMLADFGIASAICRTRWRGFFILRALWIYRGFAH